MDRLSYELCAAFDKHQCLFSQEDLLDEVMDLCYSFFENKRAFDRVVLNLPKNDVDDDDEFPIR